MDEVQREGQISEKRLEMFKKIWTDYKEKEGRIERRKVS